MIALVAEHHRYDSAVKVGSHHVARLLQEMGFEVFWLPHPRTALHRLLGPLPPALIRHDDGVVELTLRAAIPYIGLPGLASAWWGRRWLSVGPDVDRQLTEAGIDEVDLFWISDFTVLPLLDRIRARKVVFRFFDLLDRYPRMPQSIYALTRRYLDRSDLVMASARAVQERLAEERIAARYIPNGADSIASVGRLPDVDARPRAVYVGALESWFDLEAIETWARALPRVRFEIAGPNPRGLVSELGNVRFLGPIPYEEVPDFLAGAAVGLIPFRVDGLTVGAHPIKLYDYLGAGCPVVCSDLPEVSRDPRGIFKYRTYDEGTSSIRRLLECDVDRDALLRIASENGWSERFRPVLAELGFDRPLFPR